jgi:uncharacterized cupredoxin-like copper-binding protein
MSGALGAEGAQPPATIKMLAAHEKSFGREGDARKVSRTIRIEFGDAMRVFPGEVKVKRGQTLRFVVRNTGAVPHQFVLGTHEALRTEAERRRGAGAKARRPGISLAPGETVRVVWQFTRAGEFHYACLMPGHFEAGAVGTIIVR